MRLLTGQILYRGQLSTTRIVFVSPPAELGRSGESGK